MLDLFQKIKALKSISKPKKIIFSVSIISVILVISFIINLLSISIKEVKDFVNYPVGKISETVKRELQSDKRAPKGMKLVTENDYSVLFFDNENAKIAVLDKKTGKFFYSNPINLKSDSIATGSNKSKLQSQLIVNYYDNKGKSGSFNSYDGCIKQDNLAYEMIENGIRIIYSVGDSTVTREMVPAVVSKEKFEEKILKKLDEKQVDEILSYYELTSVDKSGKAASKKYQELYTKIDVSEEYYFLDLYTPDYKLDEIYNLIFRVAGYTLEEVNNDNEVIGFNIETETFKQFTIPLEIRLSEGDLIASIPSADIKSPAGLYLTEISLLPFFGAAPSKTDGYIFVPDGSGAIINFDSKNKDSSNYLLPIYGKEPNKEKKQADFVELGANLPVFGTVYNKTAAILGIIEAGESHSSIAAQVSGIDTDYNQVYPIFELLPKDIMEVESNSSVLVTNLYQEKPYEGYLTVRYKFTDESHADYGSLATIYRDYLIKNNILSKKNTERRFIVKLTGKTSVDDSILGIPYESEKVVTSFNDAEKIIKKLKTLGVANINVGYMSWFGGGIAHNVVNGREKIASGMGGEKALSSLIKTIGENGSLSLGADLIKTYNGYPHFNSFSYASRRLTNDIKKVDFYNPATYMPDESREPYYILSSRYFASVLKDFNDSVKSVGGDSVWLNDAGNLLSSDFKTGNMTDRETSKYMIMSALSEVSKDKKITFNNPNLYALKYCDTAVCLPNESSGSNILNESVPFLQIVLSGCVNYSGNAINRSGSMIDNLLKTIETGGNLYYEWIYADNTVVQSYKGAEPKELYSMYYDNWIDSAAEFYQRIENELKEIEGKQITNHYKYNNDVYVTDYEGIKVAVNYGNESVIIGDTEILAKDFKILGGNS